MQALTLTLPPESLVGVRIPPRELRQELLRRLATALFSDGILPGAAACRMAGMEKAEFQHLLGERGVAQPLDFADFEQDLTNFDAWNAR
jgi:predicted HTH domain antitoxin